VPETEEREVQGRRAGWHALSWWNMPQRSMSGCSIPATIAADITAHHGMSQWAEAVRGALHSARAVL